MTRTDWEDQARLTSRELAAKGAAVWGAGGGVDFYQIRESGNCVIWSLRKVVEGNIQNMASREMDLLPQEEIQVERVLMT